MSLKKEYLFLFLTILIIFLFFQHTLSYPWKHFDEQIIYKETLLPAPDSFSQIFDYLKHLGWAHYIEASNPFYSTISSLRRLNVSYYLLIFWLLKKSAFAYHLLSLLLHLLTCGLLFLIIHKTCFKTKTQTTSFDLIFTSLLVLIFALHPVNIESILLASNFGAPITYFFCILIFFYYTNYLQTQKNTTIFHSILIFLIYSSLLLLNEYSVTLPFIIYAWLFSNFLFNNPQATLKEVAIQKLKQIFPLILSLSIFTVNFFIFPIIRIPQENNITITLERILWLSPQIFFHFLKLIVLPIKLSLDQTDFVQLSSSLFDGYAIFCIFLMYGLILISVISFFLLRKKATYYFFIIFVPFFLSLFPFLHLVSPIYNLASERYLYLPLFFAILGTAKSLSSFNLRKSLAATSLLISISILFASRAYLRTLDWKDSASLFASAYKTAKSDLIKGLRLQMLGGIISLESKDNKSQTKGFEFINLGNLILERSIIKLDEEKQNIQNKLPLVIKFYGLDPKTIQAKVAYLLCFNKLGLEGNIEAAYNLLRPHMEDSKIIDTQILDLYLGLLFATGNLDKAEVLLNKAFKNRPSPTVFIAYAQLYKNKYKDLSKAEILLKESLKYFPYDIRTLESLKNFYLTTNKPSEYAFFSYLYGIRTHSKENLLESLKVYSNLYNQKMRNKVLKSIKILDSNHG